MKETAMNILTRGFYSFPEQGKIALEGEDNGDIKQE